MRASSFVAPLFLAATTLAQAVEEGIAPASSPPSGCKTTVDGTFEIGTLENPTLKSKRETAQEAADGALACTLKDGILHDQYGRTGSVVANRQFQFDGPPQAGAIYTGGFSVCGNNSLAIGGTTRWWRCMSGDFGNLYDEWIGAQCHEIRIQAIFPVAPSSSSVVTSASTVKVSEIAGSSPTGSVSITASGSAANASQTGSASGASFASVFSTASAFTTTPSASRSAAASSSNTPAVAPPAQNSAASSLSIASGAVLALIATILVI
ncbi:DRAP deaminase [Coniothyrium glycines]